MPEVVLTPEAVNRFRKISDQTARAVRDVVIDVSAANPQALVSGFSHVSPNYTVSPAKYSDHVFVVDMNELGSVLFTYDNPENPDHLVVLDILKQGEQPDLERAMRNALVADPAT